MLMYNDKMTLLWINVIYLTERNIKFGYKMTYHWNLFLCYKTKNLIENQKYWMLRKIKGCLKQKGDV